MSVVVKFSVDGHPVSQGSKNPVVPTYKDGEPVRRHRNDCPLGGGKPGSGRVTGCGCPVMINVVEMFAKQLEPWRDSIRLQARAAMVGEPLDGLLVAGFSFRLKRPKGHYGTGRNERVLKPHAPAAPGVIPDVGKLARAVEDAMTGIVYVDDARIVSHYGAKRYVDSWKPDGVDVVVAPCQFQTVGEMIAAGVIPSPEEEMGQLGLLDTLAS